MSSNPNYDSEFCGKVPIHLINTIQPYGMLLVIDRTSLRVIQASENVNHAFGVPASTLIRTELNAYLDWATVERLRELTAGPATNKIPVAWTINGRRFLTILHIKEKYILAELENTPYDDNKQRSFVEVFQNLKYSMSLVDAATTTVDACKVVAQELKRISGFDKVMIYRFDEEWNGTVIAEEMEPDMESYFGFTFPASDIPKQARDLYLRNPYRYIPDRTYQPVQLHPVMNPVTRGFIDLSDCNVRGVVAVHLEYLANMGIVASMSTRILHNDRLWGLIACHHKTAIQLSFESCSIFELMSHTISSRILSLENKERHDTAASVQATYTKLLEQIYEQHDLKKGLFNGTPSLLDLFKATGAALIRRGEIIASIGKIPGRERVEELVFWLHTRKLSQNFMTDHLSDHFDQATSYIEEASGLVAIPIDPDKSVWILVFRPEVKKTIDWGGDPGGRIVFEKDEKNYHPRHSFKLWRQIVVGTSRPWRQEETEIGESLRSFLNDYTGQ